MCFRLDPNGEGNAWGYRGWVMIGVDGSCTQQNGRGLNVKDRGPTRPTQIPGQHGSWGWAGSNHPGGSSVGALTADQNYTQLVA